MPGQELFPQQQPQSNPHPSARWYRRRVQFLRMAGVYAWVIFAGVMISSLTVAMLTRDLDTVSVLLSVLFSSAIYLLAVWFMYGISKTALYQQATDNKQIRRDLQIAHAQLQQFIEYHTDAIAIFDETGHITSVNAACETLFGWSRDELLGKSVREIPLIPRDLEEEEQRMLDAVQNGETQEQETWRLRADGERIAVLLTKIPLWDEEGNVVGWSATLRDLSDHKAEQQRILQSEKLAAVGQLAAGVAHEIRNPLTTILGFLSLMSKSPPKKQQEYIGIMTRELERISTIVTEMLSLSKPQETAFEPVVMAELLRSVLQFSQSDALMNNVQLAFNLSDLDEEAVVMGHENRLKQVLINLIRNAMEALGEEQRHVRLLARSTEDSIFVDIVDTGVGLTADQLEKLGEPFYTTKARGTGLGLHVCRQIVQQHEAELSFESSYGEGTTVHLVFPRHNRL